MNVASKYHASLLRWPAILACAFILYAALALFCTGFCPDWRTNVLGGGGDPISFVWFLHWWPYAVRHHENPFITHAAWYPSGFNLTWATSVPFASLLALPITMLGGAILSFNILSVFAPAFGAFTAFLLCRAVSRDNIAALIGGFLFGFSPYEFAQRLGHLNLDLDFLVPLLPLVCILRLRGDLSRRRCVIALVAIFLAQLGLSTEILASLCIFAAFTWLVFRQFTPKPGRPALYSLGLDVILAGLIAASLASPFLLFLVRGFRDVPAVINQPGIFSTDLLNFILPTEITSLGGNLATTITHKFTGNLSEQGGYLGIPLICIMLAYIWSVRNHPYGRAFFICAVAIIIFTLGPTLQIGGFDTKRYLPWAIATHLPAIGSILPGRFSMYVALAGSLATASWIASRLHAYARIVAGLAACLFIFPNPGRQLWQPWPVQPFFTPETITAIGEGNNFLILPSGPGQPEMAWQYDADLAFTQSAGYIGFVPVSEQRWPILNALISGQIDSSFTDGITAYCVTHRVTTIVEGPGTPETISAALAALPWPRLVDHGVTLITPPGALPATYRYVLGDIFPPANGWSWIGKSAEILTHNDPTTIEISGNWRPAGVPETITVSNGAQSESFAIEQSTTKTLSFPANADILITPKTLFQPSNYFPTQDARELSVALKLLP